MNFKSGIEDEGTTILQKSFKCSYSLKKRNAESAKFHLRCKKCQLRRYISRKKKLFVTLTGVADGTTACVIED